MIQTLRTCDICGKPMDEKRLFFRVNITLCGIKNSEFDMCTDCEKAFVKWTASQIKEARKK